ncbi:methyltransferase [Alteromonadaceae bacterium BrNp21-10]|nr:methyltransferase [Alteromonadaceae bacterium BrNp21-10]
MKKTLVTFALLSAFSLSAYAGDISAKLDAALKADIRTEQDTNRDRNRQPKQTLEFFGLQDDMKVIELLPGGGWYTKLLAPILKDKGEFYVAYGADRVKNNLLDKAGFEKVNVAAPTAKVNRPPGAPAYIIENADLGVKDADIVFTFRNYHNFGEQGRADMNKAAHKALKKGGIYAVVDHTRRHMQKDNDENGRRIDPVLAIKEIQAAGFELVDFSDLHYRADDELRYEVGRKTVTGNTDRWSLKFRKK